MIGYEFYQINYGGEKIPLEKWDRFSRKAKVKVDFVTFGRTSEMDPLPDEVSFCICELAEKMFEESLKNKDVSSESMDGHSVSYVQKTEKQLEIEHLKIIQEYLSNTGLLYPGAYK